jgi:adenosylmethionine-8-amino-7-oxononanoate aminotransferase
MRISASKILGLVMADKSPVWHPFTQHGLADPEISIARANGAYLYTHEGRTILDAISSWWVNIHGHGHKYIANAIAEQALRLEQVIFAGFTHEPAELLAKELLRIAPGDPSHVFFSDSGSTAVEVAIKMAVGCWYNRGKPRHRIIALEHGYHGDMFGAMSVGQRGAFNVAYEPMLFDVATLPFPTPGDEQKTLEALLKLLKVEPDAFAALIVEPLVLGASGMKMYPASLLSDMAAICKKHDVFVIADEVLTGFGRTGTMFACEQAKIAPDLLCLSKGITGGFLPMGATLATNEIYDAFYSAERAKTFFHSSSYTGNAIACAAANANLKVFGQEPVLERIGAIAAHHAIRLKGFEGRASIADIRQSGTIAALELRVRDGGYFSDIGTKLGKFYLKNDVLLRPLGNVVYVLPPYCITKDELDRIYDVIEESLDLIAN